MSDLENSRTKCLIWRGLSPNNEDGEGLFLDESGYFVYSSTPSVQRENRISKQEAIEYASRLCSPGEYEQIFEEDSKKTICMRYKKGVGLKSTIVQNSDL